MSMQEKKQMQERSILFSLVIILLAQLNMNLLLADFKISIAAVCYPVFLLLLDNFSYLMVCLGTTIGVLVSRVFVFWMQNGNLRGSVASCFPEVIFYLTYSILVWFYVVYRKKKKISHGEMLIPILFIDYISNFLELLCRIQIEAFDGKSQLGIFCIACLRSGLVWCVLTAFDQYRLFLQKKDHEERYQRLLLLISKLNDEVVWMKKNTVLIEETMRTAYLLYDQLKEEEKEEEAGAALKVARDIHEIKKEYLLIMRGLSTAMEKEYEADGMFLSEIFRILNLSMMGAAEEKGKQVQIALEYNDDIYIKKQYHFMSVFRNLLMNAVEAGEKEEVHITIREKKEEGKYWFQVEDDGPGISEENQEEVFLAGFSTKINYQTGEIARGLGLNLVKDLVEQHFQGKILLEAVPGHTVFSICIPEDQLEGEDDEYLSVG